jgi:glycosyltransferase involved in cell wall biosynthesis
MTNRSGSVVRERSKSLLVSIIIPVYQVSDYVERCLLSVMNQTYQNIECIIVDDSSTDDSIAKCEWLINEYVGPIKFHMLHHEQNRGLSAARNTGTDAASGNYIYYLDSDDEITSDCIERFVTIVMNHPDVEMVVGKHKSVEKGEIDLCIYEKLDSEYHSNEDIFYAFRKHGLPIYAWNKLIKRTFLTQYAITFIEGIVWEDAPWSFFVYKNLSNLYVCDQVTYHYYIRPNSIVTGTDRYTYGKSFSISYGVILDNLTEGREREELELYANGFCRRFLEFKTTIPVYNELMKKYRRLSMDYSSKRVLLKLYVTQHIPNESAALKAIDSIQSFRSRIKKRRKMCKSE